MLVRVPIGSTTLGRVLEMKYQSVIILPEESQTERIRIDSRFLVKPTPTSILLVDTVVVRLVRNKRFRQSLTVSNPMNLVGAPI